MLDFRERGSRQIFAEVTQATKWFIDYDFFSDVDGNTIYLSGRDAKLRLFILFTESEHQLVAGCDTLGKRRVSE